MPLSDEDKAKLLKQVEFYFSDVNITKDAFLKSKIAESAEGWVPLSVICIFNRVAAITKDPKELFETLGGSTQLVLDESTLSVRRAKPIPEFVQLDSETIYAKPIPPEATLEDLQKFFGKFGTVKAIWRRYSGSGDKKNCKPSVFVVYDAVDAVEKLTSNPPKFNEVQLEIEKKTKYLERKAAEALQAASSKRAEAEAAARPQKTSPMPKCSMVSISEVGEIGGLAPIKSLWPAADQQGIRYIYEPSGVVSVIIFQDEAIKKKMVSVLEEQGTKLNGKVPKITHITGVEEEDIIAKVEKEIADRAAKRVLESRSGRGRGGRGGRGRGGRGRGGKRRREE